jgi:hypothetical protein
MMIKERDRKERVRSRKESKLKALALKEMIGTDGYKYLKEEVDIKATKFESLNNINSEGKTEAEVFTLVKTNQAISREIRGVLNSIENYVKEVLKDARGQN